MPAGLGGAFFFLAMLAQEAESPHLVNLVVGWLYAVAIVGLMRLFRVVPAAYPLVGLLCGPVPLALFVARSMTGEEWGGFLLLGAAFGCIVGLLEWARIRALDGQEAGEDPGN
jgi:hypothetical protein